MLEMYQLSGLVQGAQPRDDEMWLSLLHIINKPLSGEAANSDAHDLGFTIEVGAASCSCL